MRVWGGSIVNNMLLPNMNSSAVFLATALNTEADIPESQLDDQDTVLILQSPSITGNTAPNVITALYDELLSGEGRVRRATVFSSSEVPVFHALQVQMAASVTIFRLTTDRYGLDANSEWFVNTFTVRTLFFECVQHCGKFAASACPLTPEGHSLNLLSALLSSSS